MFSEMDSASDIEIMQRGQYRRSMNTLRRGGIVQCRPGYEWKVNLPDGNLQGMVMFRPTDGAEQLIVAVDGVIYRLLPPYTALEPISGILFDENAPFIFWAITEQAAERNPDGSISLITPRAILMMQDGKSASAYYNGASGSHLGGNALTPMGTHMAWSGGRLWVARGRRVFASDYANPLSFVEGQYVGNIGAFILPGNVTGMAELPSLASPALVILTEDTTTLIQSNIRARDQWPSAVDFQKVVLPNIGCSAHRSVVAANGTLWFYAGQGMQRLDVALQSQNSGVVPVLDKPMGFSKSRLSPDRSVIAGAAFEDYLLMSVPYCDLYNTHTWVLGLGGESGKAGWESYWVGTRPVEWVSANFDSRPRIFYVSKDLDGHNRLWEAFSNYRRDNGCSIVWTLETRAYLGGMEGLKRWRFADVYFSELEGTVDVLVLWGPARRGRWQRVTDKIVRCQRGSVQATFKLSPNDLLYALKKQVRVLRTEEEWERASDAFSSCAVESDAEEQVDNSFQLCIIASGPGAVRQIDVHMDPEEDPGKGECEEHETELNASRYDGADKEGTDLVDLLNELEAGQPRYYVGNATAVATYRDVTTTGVATVTNSISQACVDRMAEEAAAMKAAKKLEEEAPPFLGGFGEFFDA
jgi:hypothetical protein